MQIEAGTLVVTRPYCTLSSSVVSPVPLGSSREGSVCASEVVLSFIEADSMGLSLSSRGDQDMLVYLPIGDHESLHKVASELCSILFSSPQEGLGKVCFHGCVGGWMKRRMDGHMGGWIEKGWMDTWVGG